MAGPDDDDQLRRVLSQTSMPGSLVLSFHREPSFFAAGTVEGPFRQTVACREVVTREIVGFGCRSIATRWVNGQPAPIGYLSQLRLLAHHRRQGLIARGYAFFRKLHTDCRAPIYLTTIADDNDVALEQLTSQRAGLPAYHDLGHYHSIVLNPRRLRSIVPIRGVSIRRATFGDRESVLAFLEREGPRRQFFPQVAETDLFTDDGLLRDLHPNNLWLAFEAGELVGCVGVWNQRKFRQQRIDGYSGWFRYLRPLVNLAAPVVGWPHFPPAGALLRVNFAALPVTRDHRADILLALLRHAIRDTNRDESQLLFGIHERDPWWPVVSKHQAFCYTTRLFVVSFADGEDFRRQLDGRPPYLELGCL